MPDVEPLLWSDEHHLLAAARGVKKNKAALSELSRAGSCLRLPRLICPGSLWLQKVPTGQCGEDAKGLARDREKKQSGLQF